MPRDSPCRGFSLRRIPESKPRQSPVQMLTAFQRQGRSAQIVSDSRHPRPAAARLAKPTAGRQATETAMLWSEPIGKGGSEKLLSTETQIFKFLLHSCPPLSGPGNLGTREPILQQGFSFLAKYTSYGKLLSVKCMGISNALFRQRNEIICKASVSLCLRTHNRAIAALPEPGRGLQLQKHGTGRERSVTAPCAREQGSVTAGG